MKGVLLDGLSLVLLIVAIALWVWPRPQPAEGRVLVPMLMPQDQPGSLHLPGADERVLAAQAAAMGEVLTIEDLVRVVVALESGGQESGGQESDPQGSDGDDPRPPLSEDERAQLRVLLERAQQHRERLLQVEGQLSRAEDRLDAAARDVAAQLSPQQRAWIQEHRNETSVKGVEDAYWQDAARGLK